MVINLMIDENKYYRNFYILNLFLALCMFLNIVILKGNRDKYLGILICVYLSFIVSNRILNKKLFKCDESLSLIINVLILISIIMLYRINRHIAMKQCFFIVIGYISYLLIMFYVKDINEFYKYKVIYFILTAVFMSLSFFFGKYINGSKNWVSLFGITFQPSEFGKIFLILYISSLFKNEITFKDITMVTCLFLLIFGCFILQKDLGTLLIIFLTTLFIYYIKTGNNKILIFSFLFLALSAIVSYKLIPHVKVRIDAWLFPHKDPFGVSYQVLQGFFSMGYGGFLGKGLYYGSLEFIPVNYTDYIFVSIVEEFGIITGIIITMFYFIFFLRIIIKIFTSENNKSSILILILGFTLLISIQAILILGGIINLIPLTGVTLPFVSYGGSSIISLFIIFSLMQKVLKEF